MKWRKRWAPQTQHRALAIVVVHQPRLLAAHSSEGRGPPCMATRGAVRPAWCGRPPLACQCGALHGNHQPPQCARLNAVTETWIVWLPPVANYNQQACMAAHKRATQMLLLSLSTLIGHGAACNCLGGTGNRILALQLQAKHYGIFAAGKTLEGRRNAQYIATGQSHHTIRNTIARRNGARAH